jgi:hypothetical protein
VVKGVRWSIPTSPYRGLFRASGAFSRNQFSVDYSIRDRFAADCPADRRTHLEQMRVLVGVAEDAGHLHVRTADLLGDVAVEVLGGDDADRLTRHLRQYRRCEQDCECGQGRELFHPDPPVRHGLDGA